MNWITKLTPPGVKSIFSKKDTPDNLWVKCPKSGEMVFAADMPSLLHVTPAGHHMRIGPAMRMDYTFDNGEYEVIPTLKVANDPLKFKDDQKYVDRLKKARNKTGNEDAMNIGVGNIHGIKTVVLVQNFAFMGGSLGMAAGEGFIQAAEYAIAHNLPMVVFTAAGGARMQEGALSLMQMPRTTIAVQEMRENGLPYIVVLCDPTTGGVTASYAMLGDVHLAEPGALICFAGPRVIEDTIREKLPEGFQRAEYLEEKGMIDRVVPRKEMRQVLSQILSVLMKTDTTQPKVTTTSKETSPEQA